MLLAGMQRDTATLKALTVAWQANGQAFGGQHACGGCCGEGGWDPPREVCAHAWQGRRPHHRGLCGTVPGAYMPGWRMPMADVGSMGSATDADEDAVSGIIYLAELTGDDGLRNYALMSIAAFVNEVRWLIAMIAMLVAGMHMRS